jgi:murein L,D-transpeptidase YcbB/YkuD
MARSAIVIVLLALITGVGHADHDRPGALAASQLSVAAADPDVTATIERVLASAEHPHLASGSIPDVVPILRPLYGAEPDRLLWFEGMAPVPAVERTLATLAAAGDHGLDPAQYEAAGLNQQWDVIKGKGAAAPDRALFDVGLSVAAARLLRAVAVGRIDPATMDWGYHVARKSVDHAALLHDVRDGKGLAATLDALQPPVAHYARARATLAVYKAMARSGEPEAVPDLVKPPSVKPGMSWQGTTALAAARLRRPRGQHPAARRPALIQRPARRRRQGVPVAPRPGSRWRHRSRHHPRAQRHAGPSGSPDRVGNGTHALAARPRRHAKPVRQRRPVPHVGH